MNELNRRHFLKVMGSAALAGSVPAHIKEALAIPAHHRTGSIADVEHIVILMQENRSFDHYFGTLRGVRGFGDPRAVTLPSGRPVWFQPDGSGYQLPFRPDVPNLGNFFPPDPPHGWNDTHAAWNQGRHDQWVPNKGITAMTYHRRDDLPYHFALAESFTICDAYHCSVMGPTDPNRYHMWTGWVGNDGRNGGPVITNAELGYDWSTYPERLERAGISWKVYQDSGVGLDAAGFWGWTGDEPYIGNYGDNSLLYFHQYQNALPGNPLADKAKVGTNIGTKRRNPFKLVEDFRADVRTNKLPQISWIVAPEAYSEHPNFPANFGAWYISQFMEALVSNPDVWSKTVLFINYDEEGGFFDHQVPPTPPQTREQGLSTVDLVNEIFPGDGKHPSAPYGLGMRVPMLVVSPWSKGGWVNSQVFDHTSLIKFIEARHARGNPDLIEHNITPWRRAVAGDLTSAFDFSHSQTRRPRLPSTAAFVPQDFLRHDDQVPVPPLKQLLPKQEPGIRLARALPYALFADGSVKLSSGAFAISFGNTGDATAVFHVRSANMADLPRSFTVEPGKALSDTWNVALNGSPDYDLAVHGPNGFFRGFKGSVSGQGKAIIDVLARDDEDHDAILLTFINRATQPARIVVLNQYTGQSVRLDVDPGKTGLKRWSLERSFGWYDLVVRTEHDSGFECRVAGHMENGRDSVSDPAIGGLALRGDHGADSR